MLAITLGTIASGSTWVFNVVRSLFAHARPDAVSLSAAEATSLLAQVPPGCRNILLKAHYTDSQLLTLAALFPAKTIVTTRDPRDSFVSQRERFGASLNEAISDLTRTSATFAMLHENAPTMLLRYEDGFTDDPRTIEKIASFLEFEIGAAEMRRIFDQYRPEKVARSVDRSHAAGRLRTTGFDQATHWHQGHVGDRQSGKWRQRLQPEDQEAVMGAIGSDLHDLSPAKSVYWSPKLFTYFDGRAGSPEEIIECMGEECALIWGPYQYLPAGRWQITPKISLETSATPVSIRVDTFIPVEGREILALRTVNIPNSSPDRLVMEFDHHNHLEPVELRISSIADGRRALIKFSGAELERLGPSERVESTSARLIGESLVVDS